MNKGKINTMIIEDNHDARCLLEGFLKEHTDINLVATASTVDEATLAWLKFKPELVFLDVELDDHSGFEFLEKIQEFASGLTVIFTTAYEHYSLQAIKHAAFDYLLKPIDPAELLLALEKYRAKESHHRFTQNLESLTTHLHENKHLKLPSKHGFVVVHPADILYCKADWNYTEIFLVGNTRHLVTQNIGSLTERLPQKDFIRANRSLLLNINYLKSVDKHKGTCTLKNGPEEIVLPLSATKIRILEKMLIEKSY
jgi:two-component system, LytTR family, response regulator